MRSKYASEFCTYFKQYKWLNSTKDHLYVESFRTKIVIMTLTHKNIFGIYSGRDSIRKHSPKPKSKNLANWSTLIVFENIAQNPKVRTLLTEASLKVKSIWFALTFLTSNGNRTLSFWFCLSLSFEARITFWIIHKWQDNSSIFRSGRPEMFYKICVPRSFAKFTGKNLYQSLFLNKAAITKGRLGARLCLHTGLIFPSFLRS